MLYIKRKILILIIISFTIIIYPIKTKTKEINITRKKYINIIKNIAYNKKEDKLLTLIIPKIKLNKDIYQLNSPKNNIRNNIQILSSSNLNKNLFILASHSGTNNNAYFNNLYLLNLKDIIYISKNNNNYTYQVVDLYYIKKTGYLKLEKNLENTLILITCSTTYTDKQLIVISKLKSINNVYVRPKCC